MAAERFDVHITKVLAIDEDISRCWIVQAGDKRSKSRLARPGKTDDTGVLVSLDVQRKVVDNLDIWTGRISEVDVADLDITLNFRQGKTLVVCAIDVGLTLNSIDNLSV